MTVALGIPALRVGVPAGASAGAGSATQPPAGGVAARPRDAGAGLSDRFGRVATDLRVSLTDRCNLRCTYCMPAEGLPFLPRPALMSRAEIVRLVRLAAEHLGVRQVRFTGGEPLLRADLVDIVREVAALDPRPEISLTTNAIGLASRAAALAEAGLDRVNVSLDSIEPATFEAITRRPFLDRVLAGIDAVRSAGLVSTKVNAVLMRGVNDHQAVDLLDWALAGGHQLRFIEQMPLDADHSWSRTDMITAAEIRGLLEERYRLAPDDAPRDGAPAELYRVYDGERMLGRVGVIASVTEAFCSDCRRTRLTAEGRVRSCLFSHTETDLLEPMRSGASDNDLADLWRAAMWAKPAGHGLDDPTFAQPARTMSAIGG
ncbi:GTP 3',8-cyclase MoaA [Humibacter sp. BT305]|nr:GTP 3',8-cyclase MoaA [Humibacter sp. BT305]